MRELILVCVSAIALPLCGAVPVAAESTVEQYEVGRAAFARGDYAAALNVWHPMAEQGIAQAQFSLGIMYVNGLGVAPDKDEEVYWEQKAADQGYAPAEQLVGTAYLAGEGVPQNSTEAARWLEKAADQGIPSAEETVGVLYSSGTGLPQSYATGLMWFHKAADQGNADAMKDLGFAYAEGLGVPQDNDEAARWYRMAADQRHQDAERKFGYSPTEANSSAPATPPESPMDKVDASRVASAHATTRVALKVDSGAFVVPILLNGAITLDFVIDSGATDVCVPADVVLTLMRTGTLKSEDFAGAQTYVMADGTRVPSRTFVIRSLKVGNQIIQDVRGSIVPVNGTLLLGQSFLKRFKSWSIDNTTHELVLDSGTASIRPRRARRL